VGTVSAGEGLVEVGVGGLDDDTSAAWHRVARVHDEVHDDLLDLARVGLDVSQIRLEVGFQIDVLAD